MKNAEWPETAPRGPRKAKLLHSAFFLLHSHAVGSLATRDFRAGGRSLDIADTLWNG